MAGVEAIELISSCRGKQKAKMGKWTYTMDKRVNDRFHWRCDVRACRGRLTTDLYNGRHMLFRSKPHCLETHRQYRSRGKVPPLEVQPLESAEVESPDEDNAADAKQQTVKGRARIGSYVYVLERVRGELHFWRCERRSCTGRCRSLNGVMVAGPSEHAHEPPPEEGQQVDTPVVVGSLTSTSALPWNSDEPEEYISIEPSVVIEDAVEGNRHVSRKSSVQPGEPARSDQKWHPPPPPLQIGSSAAQRYAIVTSSGGGHVAAPLGTDSAAIRIKSVQGSADLRSSEGHITLDTPMVHVSEDDPAGAPYWEGIEKQDDSGRSHWIDLGRHKRSRLDVLEMSGLGGRNAVDARERELRLDILLQTRRLLEAETELLTQQRKNEELRHKILRRQLQSMVSSDPQG